MCRKYIKFGLFLVCGTVISAAAYGQDASDVLRYSLQYPEQDPITLVMPGVSDATGFGAYQENPAVTALFDHSYFSAGLSDRYVNEDGFYIRNNSSGDVNQANISHAGFVYKFPTKRGKLSIGAGYSQSHDFNRALSVHGRNNVTTITDFYNSSFSRDSVFFAAFDAFAIDFAGPDSSFSNTKSIFRFGDYRGINQRSESTKRGVLGEYSAFASAEVAKNLIVGASIGVIAGSYNYRRDFLESDDQNDYETQFEDQNGNLTGIDNILSHDEVDEDFTAFSLRLGAVYQISSYVNIGAAYQFKNVVHIDETFNTTITNTLDDGTQFEDDAPAELNYRVVRPARFNFGLSAKNLSGFTISASGQHVAYSQARIRFEDLNLKEDEQFVNDNVDANLDDVINFRAGLQYAVSSQFIPRLGYAYYPSPVKDANFERNFYSAGFSSQISESTQFNLGVQLGRWKDDRVLYSTPQGDEVADEDVNHWHIMAGLKFGF